MSITATTENIVLDKFTAVDFLVGEKGRTLLLNDVSWNEYEMFLEDFEERAGWRLTYDRRKLEIMPPTPDHEEYSFNFHNFVLAYCERFEVELEGRKSTTFRRKFLEKGVEPDECYYIQSAEKIAGKKLPAKDFPIPDIAVKVDITHGSLDKFPIYAALQVPEIWLLEGEDLVFYELQGETYRAISHSRAMPHLSSETLADFLKISREKGQMKALKSFRAWLGEIETE